MKLGERYSQGPKPTTSQGSNTPWLVFTTLFQKIELSNPAWIYGVLTALIISAYALSVGAVGALLRVNGNIALSFIATLLAAIAFNPIREQLQRAANRLLYGERDEPYKVLTRLGQLLEVAIQPTAALPLAVETVAQALKLPYVAVALNANTDSANLDPQNKRRAFAVVAAYGSSPNLRTVFPLMYAGEPIGELIVTARSPNEPLSESDHQLLGDLAKQMSIAAHAALLTTDLERARLRIVAAREEARRHLGRDLHDGVGHQLVGLTRQVELASQSLVSNPVAAQKVLLEITQQLNATTIQVRSLAHQLHPPELELLGLAGALRERIQTHTGLLIRLDAPENLPSLPTAIETAAYYIALEALTNVEKHAQARSCQLKLAFVVGTPPALELEITDDGQGLAQESVSGLGLLSMQARAAEVGGLCRIESTAQGGTCVKVRLPCPAQLK